MSSGPTNLGRLGDYVHLDSGDTVIVSFSSSGGPFEGNVSAIDELFLDLAKECLSQHITIAENFQQSVDYGDGVCIVGYYNFIKHFFDWIEIINAPTSSGRRDVIVITRALVQYQNPPIHAMLFVEPDGATPYSRIDFTAPQDNTTGLSFIFHDATHSTLGEQIYSTAVTLGPRASAH